MYRCAIPYLSFEDIKDLKQCFSSLQNITFWSLKNTAIWDVTPRNVVEIYHRVGVTYSSHVYLVSCSTLTMESTGSSEGQVNFCQNTQCQVSEVIILCSHHREKLKLWKLFVLPF